MTNLEWLLSLSVEDMEKRYHAHSCSDCVYENSTNCNKKSCVEGRLKWLNAEHTLQTVRRVY